jgi:tetratricopeptide (TPR) repeat protein
MTLSGTSYRTTRKRARALAALWLACLALSPRATAQDSLEQRYQRAMAFFNSAKMEDACELFQQVEKEKPGYKETHTYLNPACSSARLAYALEEKLFNEATQLFNQGHIDDAKDKFQQASRIPLNHPKYRTQCDQYLRQIEGRLSEDSLFQQAVGQFNAGKYDEASALFTQIARSGGTRASEAQGYLQRISEGREESAYNAAVRAFANGDLSSARRLLGQVIDLNGKHKADAQNYLARINSTENEQQVFDGAVQAFNGKRYDDARAGFNQVVQRGGSRAGDARAYLDKIDAAVKQQATLNETVKKATETGENPKQIARRFVGDAQTAIAGGKYSAALDILKAAESLDPSNADVRRLTSQAQALAAEEPLRNGLEAYFEGKFDEAERDLSAYVSGNGSKRALAYFFRGAVHGSRFFLSGERDAQQKELALADFRTLQKDARAFQPPKKFVSAKILALYSQAVDARQP